MATNNIMSLFVLVMGISAASLISSADVTINITGSSNDPNRSEKLDALGAAMEEMQRANYFSFVMLIKMAPRDYLGQLGNLTFLMPNDKALSSPIITASSAVDFLLGHSIPSALLFRQQLQHLPTASILPTAKSDHFLRITNEGRRRFFLNNVRITRPDICSSSTTSSSITCHGIDGVVRAWPPPPAHHNCNFTNATPATTTPEAPAPVTAPPPEESASHHQISPEFLTASHVMLLAPLLYLFY